MKKVEITNILENFQTELFAFGHALIPDELQVQQMVVDIINLLLVEETFKSDLLEVMKGKTWEPEDKFKLRMHLLKNLYSMAKRRYTQIKASLNTEGKSDFPAFFALGFEERALIWLQTKTNLESEDIRQIFGFDRSKLLSSLSKARKNLNELHTGAI